MKSTGSLITFVSDFPFKIVFFTYWKFIIPPRVPPLDRGSPDYQWGANGEWLLSGPWGQVLEPRRTGVGPINLLAPSTDSLYHGFPLCLLDAFKVLWGILKPLHLLFPLALSFHGLVASVFSSFSPGVTREQDSVMWSDMLLCSQTLSEVPTSSPPQTLSEAPWPFSFQTLCSRDFLKAWWGTHLCLATSGPSPGRFKDQ